MRFLLASERGHGLRFRNLQLEVGQCMLSVCRAHTSIVASVLPRARPDSDHQMARRRGRRRLPVPVAGAIIIMMIRVTGIAAAAASHCAIQVRRRRADPDRDSDSESGRDSESERAQAPTVALSGSAAPAGLRPPARLLPGSAGGPLQWRQAGGPDPGRP